MGGSGRQGPIGWECMCWQKGKRALKMQQPATYLVDRIQRRHTSLVVLRTRACASDKNAMGRRCATKVPEASQKASHGKVEALKKSACNRKRKKSKQNCDA